MVIKSFFNKYPYLSFILVIFLIISGDFIYFLSTKQYTSASLGLASSLSLFLMPCYFFRNDLKKYMYILIPILILVPINLGSLLVFYVQFNKSTIQLFLNTDFNESFELLKGYIIYIIVFLFIYIKVIFFMFSVEKIEINKNVSIGISLISLLVLLALPFTDKSEKKYANHLVSIYYDIYPTSLVYSIKKVYQDYTIIKESKEEREKFKFDAKIDSNVTYNQTHVLIIGESSRYSSWGINGYKRNTTPRLSSRKQLINFSDVSSGATITDYAVPLLLTGVGANRYNEHFKRKSVVSVFREAGFKTYWISNQLDNGHTNMHMNEAEYKIGFMNDAKAHKTNTYDSKLIEKLADVLSQKDKNKFIVIHTMGSHYDYSIRYPQEFDIYKPSNKTVFSKSADKKFKDVIVNSYDNSILYTDYVLDSIISLMSSKNLISSVTYISDHGENLFDDSRGFSQHGQSIPTPYVAHIPFFVWYSEKYELLNPDKIKILYTNNSNKISSQNLLYTLSGIANIKFPSNFDSLDISSVHFKKNNQLLFNSSNKIFRKEDLK